MIHQRQCFFLCSASGCKWKSTMCDVIAMKSIQQRSSNLYKSCINLMNFIWVFVMWKPNWDMIPLPLGSKQQQHSTLQIKTWAPNTHKWAFAFAFFECLCLCVCVCARENKRIDKLVDHHRRRRRHYGTFDFGCIAFDGAYEISKKPIVSSNFYLIFYFEISCAYAYLFMCRSNNTPCAVSVPPMCVFCVFICLFILLLKWKFNSEKKRKKKKNHVTNPSIESKWQWTPIGNIDICIDGENNWG